MKLKGKQLGVKFRRQYSVGSYILDFYAPELRLGIEVDGDTHGFSKVLKRGKLKEKYISDQGIMIIRFTNEEIYKNITGVLQAIL